MTALSGVRSSCDMLARNSDLCWLAISSCALLRSSSRKRRALLMATADWLASVSSRLARSPAGTRPARCAARRARRRSASSRTSGTATQRAPARGAGAPRGARRAARASRSAICSGCPPAAARPTNVSSRWIRARGGPRRSSSLVPTQVRTSNARVCLVVLEDRAAVGVGQATACVTIVVSTSSRSRLELTAWLTSPSALSSSTERASSRPRCWSPGRAGRSGSRSRPARRTCDEARSSGRRTGRPRRARA